MVFFAWCLFGIFSTFPSTLTVDQLPAAHGGVKSSCLAWSLSFHNIYKARVVYSPRVVFTSSILTLLHLIVNICIPALYVSSFRKIRFIKEESGRVHFSKAEKNTFRIACFKWIIHSVKESLILFINVRDNGKRTLSILMFGFLPLLATISSIYYTKNVIKNACCKQTRTVKRKIVNK